MECDSVWSIRQLLFEIGQQKNDQEFYNYAHGVWYKRVSSLVSLFVDDYGVVGNYVFPINSITNIVSLKVANIDYYLTETLNNCLENSQTFFYDYAEQTIYIHFINDERQLGKEIVLGIAIGYASTFNNNTENIYNNSYYDPRLLSGGNLRKNIDPLFYGKLQYDSASISFINADGHFDNWRKNNFFGSQATILYSSAGNKYSDFEKINSGFISDDSTTWDNFSIKIDDQRRSLEQPVATNIIAIADYPNALRNHIDERKGVSYGKLFKRKCWCIDETGPYVFSFCDTEFNAPTSLDGVFINGVAQSPSNINLSAGTFELAGVADDLDNVYASFTMPITNGVEIIKDLLLRYDNKIFNETFFDVAEVNVASRLCRNTSLFINDDTKLSDAIESVCFDCDLRFFVKDNGKMTMRLYDENRIPTASVLYDDWTDDAPATKNTGSQYLTSATVKYLFNDEDDKHTAQYLNSDYEQAAYGIYKKYKTKTFETQLYEESAAIEKSNTIMAYSSNISDIITRSVSWDFLGLELTDFILAAPKTRIKDRENETLSIYEIIGIEKNLQKFDIKLTLRYVKENE